MENTMNAVIKKDNKFFKILKKIWKALHNPTFLYILKRVLSSLFTLLLLIAVLTVLIRLLPDSKFYDLQKYRSLAGKKGGEIVAERYKITELYKAGRVDLNGNPIPVISTILKNWYYYLPIYKEVPFKWNLDYTEVAKNGYWKGFIYFGRTSSGQFVLDMFKDRIGISFALSISITIFTYILSIPLGIAMAKKPGGAVDKIGNVFIVLNYAIPALVFYLAMNVLLGNANGPFGWADFKFFYVEGELQTLFPPIFCAVFLSIPGVSIWIRRFMIDELSSDYVKFARAKGLPERTIMYKHVFRNAMIPLVRNIPGTFIGAIVGSYYIEYIWGIPGTGILLINALQSSTPEVPVIQSLTLIYAALSMLSFLLGDLITVFFDPRIKLEA